MPLVIVANSPDKEAALAGLERWKASHPEAAAHLAVTTSSSTRCAAARRPGRAIRVNLRHVPEEIRPAGDAGSRRRPDAEWREKMRATEDEQ